MNPDGGLPDIHDEVVPVLDFGSQYSQLLCRRVREAGVFSELLAPDTPPADLKSRPVKGLILSGGPGSAYAEDAPRPHPDLLDWAVENEVPVLGICYGMQVACRQLGADVRAAEAREYGGTRLEVVDDGELLRDLPKRTTVWMSHGDQVMGLPDSFVPLAKTATCPYAATRHRTAKVWGLQFHPEVTHTPRGETIFTNFLKEICGCRMAWRMGDFVGQAVQRVREQVGDAVVLCGLSGGVDSSVTAALLHRAIGDRLKCIFVDNGLLRKGERAIVEHAFAEHFGVDLRVADAADDFLRELRGVVDPQEKRRVIGREFIEAFTREAAGIADAKFLAQGTLYPDVIESGHGHSGHSANIKLHHNVGGLPAELGFALVEPLRELFKDEVRAVGEVLGLPERMVWRHPFPGPGLAVRVIGEVTPDRLAILREADEIVLEELTAADLYRKTAQVFAVLLPIGTVGVMGDGRSYDHIIAVRAVESRDFMTADWARLPHEVLASMSTRIINEVRGVGRVVYDVSSKPPATIEWE